MIRRSSFLTAFLLLSTAVGRAAEKPCASPEYKALDFWVGEWEVVSPTGERQGSNLIEKVLDGCAILEHWRDVKGAEGKSFFYYHQLNRAWKQVWVTNQGATKEKMLMSDFAGPGVRFQGELPRKDGKGTYLDRTTITPLEGGRVRQRIEISLDQGKTWDVRFAWEGIYVPRGR
jgi:hypothetical protein